MVEEELEIGNVDKDQTRKGYTLCDGCDVELSASDDIFEKNCKDLHILCSDCYNLWFDGFRQLNINVTQDWRRQIEHILCPICDDVIIDHGKLDLNKLTQQIENLQMNSTHHHNNKDTKDNHSTSSEGTRSNGSTPQHVIVKTVDLSGSSSQNINININNIQSAIHITQTHSNHSSHSPIHDTSDTSHSTPFEMISTADFLSATH